MDRELIEKLSDDYERKRMVFECHQSLNVFGVTELERQRMAREYHIAEAECLEAKTALEAAKRPAREWPPKWAGDAIPCKSS